MTRKNGWDEWGKHVIEELRRHSDACENMHDELTIIRTELAALKVKSGIWGVIGGAIPVLVLILIEVLSK